MPIVCIANVLYCMHRDLKNFVKVDAKDSHLVKERFKFLYLNTPTGIVYEDLFKETNQKKE